MIPRIYPQEWKHGRNHDVQESGRTVRHSGNPAGRPKGSRNQATALVEALMEGESEALVRKAIELALAGNVRLLKTFLELLIAKPRGTPVELEIEPGREGDPMALLDAGMRALCAGELSPADALPIARMAECGSRMRARETLAGLRREEAVLRAEERALRRQETSLRARLAAARAEGGRGRATPKQAAPARKRGATPASNLFPAAERHAAAPASAVSTRGGEDGARPATAIPANNLFPAAHRHAAAPAGAVSAHVGEEGTRAAAAAPANSLLRAAARRSAAPAGAVSDHVGEEGTRTAAATPANRLFPVPSGAAPVPPSMRGAWLASTSSLALAPRLGASKIPVLPGLAA